MILLNENGIKSKHFCVIRLPVSARSHFYHQADGQTICFRRKLNKLN